MAYEEFRGELDKPTEYEEFSGKLDSYSNNDAISQPKSPEKERGLIDSVIDTAKEFGHALLGRDPNPTIREGRSVMENYQPTGEQLQADVDRRLSYKAGPISSQTAAQADLVRSKMAETKSPIVKKVAKAMDEQGTPSFGDLVQRAKTTPDATSDQADREERRQLAEDNPYLSALGAGAATGLAGVINIPTVAADFVNQSAVNPVLKAFGLPEMQRTPQMIGTEYLTKAASDYMPPIGNKSMKGAWNRDEFAKWLGVKLASNSIPMAQSLAAAFAPPLRAALLPSMGATAAGQSYVQGDDSRVAVAKGLVEAATEMLPLGAIDKIGDVLRGMGPTKSSAVTALAAQRLLQAGGVITANSLTGAIEESAAQLSNNALDKYFQGKDIELTNGLAESAVVGAASGGVMSAPQVAGVATGAYEPKNVVARELSGLLEGGQFGDQGVSQNVSDRLRTESITGQIRPGATVVNFTEPDSPSAQVGLTPIVVPVQVATQETIDVSTNSGARTATGLGGIAGSDQFGGGLGLSGSGVDVTGRLRSADAAGTAANAGENVAAGSRAGEQLAGIAMPKAVPMASDADLLARIEGGSVAAQEGNANAPAEQWFGRKGDGYITETDAEQALPGRQRMFPELGWKVEQMPSGKYRLAGYEQNVQTQTKTSADAVPIADDLSSLNQKTGTSAAAPILQNRDRSTPSSVVQMRSIAAKPDYGRLGFSRDFANGAPVVAGGQVPAQQLGKQDVAVASDGRRIPVQYAVMEAQYVLPSNQVDGTPNPEYGTAVGRVRAISGNGRVAGLQAAYAKGTAGNYVQELSADNLHGINPQVIAGMKQPVLVRVMPTSAVTADIGDVSNTTGNLTLSPVEQAKNDGQRVALDALQFSNDGSITSEAVRQFVRAMPQAEQGGLIDTNGQPTKQAVDRINAAVFSRAYGNDGLVRLYAQAQDPEARLLMSALAQAAPKMARLDGAGELDIRSLVTEAVEIAVNARRNGVPLQRAAQQLDMTADPDVAVLLDMFALNSRSSKKVAEALMRAADFAYNESTKSDVDMFGEVPKAPRSELIKQFEVQDEQAIQTTLEDAAGGFFAGENAVGRRAVGQGPSASVQAQAGRIGQAQGLNDGTQTPQAIQTEAQGQEAPVASTRQLTDLEQQQPALPDTVLAELSRNPQSADIRSRTQAHLNNLVAAGRAPEVPQLGTPDSEAEGTINALGNLFGAATGIDPRVVAYSQPGGDNGFALGGIAFVNTAMDLNSVDAPRTTWHELRHVAEQMGKAGNKAAQDFTAQMDSIFDDMTDAGKRAYVENFLFKSELGGIADPVARQARVNELMQLPLLRSEMVADFLGNRSQDRKFLIDLAQADPQGFEGFVRKWLAVIDNLLAKLKGGKTQGQKESALVDQYVRDLNKAKMVARDALIAFRKGNLGEARAAQNVEADTEVAMSADKAPSFSKRLGKDTSAAEAVPFGQELIAIHNLTTENLLYANEIGGFPVPSIGITKASTPFYAFGNITMIAPKGMIDPATGTPVFDRDAYTSRFPDLNYKKVPSKKADAFYAEMKQVVNMGDDGAAFLSRLWDGMTDSSASPDNVVSAFDRYNAPKILYAKEVLGKTVKVPMRDIALNSPASSDKEVIKFLLDNEGALKGRDGFTNEQYETALAGLKDVVFAAIDRYVEKKFDDADRRSNMAKIFKESVLDSDGDLSSRSYQVLMQDMKNVGKKTVDVVKLTEQIRKIVPYNDPAYRAWAKSKTAGLFAQPTIKVGGRQVPPTLDNIVAAMTTGATAGAEKTMTSGTGKISAMLGKRFKSLEEIKASREQVVSSSQEDAGKKSTEKLIDEYQKNALQFFTQKNWRGEVDTWEGLNASMEALGFAGKSALTDGNMRIAMQRKGFKGMDQKTIDLAKQSVDALRSAVTDYFEAKPQRSVLLSEFRGAVVPKGADPQALEVLAQNNIEIVEYNPKKEGDRATKLQKLAKKLDKADGDIMFSKRQTTPLGFYSALADGIEKINARALPPSGWKDAIKGLINKGQVKGDEIEWSGLNDWLDLQEGKVTKEQVGDYLRGNGVQVEETVLDDGSPDIEGFLTINDMRVEPEGDARWFIESPTGSVTVARSSAATESDAKAFGVRYFNSQINERNRERRAQKQQSKYGQYTLPGGENYREVLLTLPMKAATVDTAGWTVKLKRAVSPVTRKPEYEVFNAAGESQGTSYSETTEDAAIRNVARTLAQRGTERANYKSSHWDQPNILAHIRVNDRTDADGKRVLFVEEIQSDWGQEGKKKGFSNKKLNMENPFVVFNARTGENVARFRTGAAAEAYIAEQGPTMSTLDYEDTSARGGIENGMVPAAPFVTKTEGWLNLALKRVMIMAAEGGYDKVAFVNGEQSADRYDLSKQVDEVSIYGENTLVAFKNGARVFGKDFNSESELADMVGKEVANKLLKATPDKDGVRSLKGQDLKVGGEGMKTFYDTIVPTALKKLLPKVGGEQVTQISVDRTTFGKRGRTADWNPRDGVFSEQTGFEVTDAMREKVSEGLPMFSRRQADVAIKTDDEVVKLFADVQEARGLKAVRAKEAMSAHPMGDQLVKINNDFYDILEGLDDAGLIEINC